MATILNCQSYDRLTLQNQHLFGRQKSVADTLLTSPDTSRIHAVILWDGVCWLLQDTSTNGTYLNGVRVESNVKVCLNLGDNIYFAGDQSNTWKMIDLDPPVQQAENMPVTLAGNIGYNENQRDSVCYSNEDNIEEARVMATFIYWQRRVNDTISGRALALSVDY